MDFMEIRGKKIELHTDKDKSIIFTPSELLEEMLTANAVINGYFRIPTEKNAQGIKDEYKEIFKEMKTFKTSEGTIFILKNKDKKTAKFKIKERIEQLKKEIEQLKNQA